MKRLFFAIALLTLAVPASKAQEATPKQKAPRPTLNAKHPIVNDETRATIASAVRVALARHYAKNKDILNWGKMLFPEKFDLPFCDEMHGYFINIRGADYASTEAPRNHSKTTVKCFLIPIFQALEEPKSFDFYLNVQATDQKALAVNRAIKAEFEENPELRALYGNQIGSRWTDEEFVLKNGVIFKAVGAGKSLRGIQYRNKRPNYIIVDDLYDEEDLNNPDSTLKKNAWFWGTLYPARAKARRCAVHVQGTAINNDDLLEQLKKKGTEAGGRWACRTFRAIKDWDAKTVLWPELNTFDSLMADMSDMGSLIFNREMQNERWDEESAIVKRSWLYPTDGRPSWEVDLEDLKFDRDTRLIAVRLGNDPSIGEKSQNDYNAIALVWVVRQTDAKAPRFYISDLWNDHKTLDERVRLLEEIKEAQPEGRKITQARIEGIAGFKDYVAEAKRRTSLPIKAVDQVKDKITVLQNKSKFFEQQRVFLSKRIPPPLKDALVYQLITNYPKFDDMRDALLLVLDDGNDWGWV